MSSDVRNASAPRHVAADGGAAVWAMGSLFEIKLGPADTGGALGLAVVEQPAGVATPLHRHAREAEVFHLLSGRIRYEAGGVEHELTTGSTMYLPPGVAHRFLVVDDARLLAIVTAGGLLDLYAEVGVPAGQRIVPPVPDPDEIARWSHVAPRYGLEVLGPPLRGAGHARP